MIAFNTGIMVYPCGMKDPRFLIVAVLIMFMVTAVAGIVMRSMAWVDISPIGLLFLSRTI